MFEVIGRKQYAVCNPGKEMCRKCNEKYSEKVDECHHPPIEESTDEDNSNESSTIPRPSHFLYDFSSSIRDFFELLKESFSLQSYIFLKSRGFEEWFAEELFHDFEGFSLSFEIILWDNIPSRNIVIIGDDDISSAGIEVRSAKHLQDQIEKHEGIKYSESEYHESKYSYYSSDSYANKSHDKSNNR